MSIIISYGDVSKMIDEKLKDKDKLSSDARIRIKNQLLSKINENYEDTKRARNNMRDELLSRLAKQTLRQGKAIQFNQQRLDKLEKKINF